MNFLFYIKSSNLFHFFYIFGCNEKTRSSVDYKCFIYPLIVTNGKGGNLVSMDSGK